MPPGRASIRQNGRVAPCGPHHRAKCSASVHARNTASRGAAKVRVITSWPPSQRTAPGTVPGLLAAVVIALLLPLKLAEVLVQPVEALLPVPAVALHPVVHLAER